ncbi:MAG: histidine kinase [Planctomycetota bacterium]|nr:MAG: histidine kinase [Planctomycetota bacterium]
MSLVRHVLESKGRDVARVPPDATVLQAATIMNERRIGCVMVMDGDRIAGIFTERDILCRVVAARKDPALVKVSEVMTTKVAVCSPDTTIEACRSAMTRNKLRHLPVVDGTKLVGMVSSGDILARELKEQEETIHWLHQYMHGPN